MKSLKSLNFGANEVLQRNEMKTVFGGHSLTKAPIGDGGGTEQCSSTGCEGQSSGGACIINGRSGTCKMMTCAGTNQLLCDAPL